MNTITDDLVVLFNKKSLNIDDKLAFLTGMFPFFHLDDEAEVNELFLIVKDHITQFLTQFRSICLGSDFGFDAYDVREVVEFFVNPSQMVFSFNKQKGKQILYGLDHVLLRRHLLNGLPFYLQKDILLRKFHYYNLSELTGIFFSSEFNDKSIKMNGFEDIGMGASVYCVEIKQFNPSKWVFKKEESYFQPFISRILTLIGWPSYHSYHSYLFDHNDNEKWHNWQVTEFLNGRILKDFSFDVGETVEKELAYHAALGDFLGRGDRHLENYVISSKNLYPVDIAYLFCEDNEFWINKYVAGGRYELNVLDLYVSDFSELNQKMKEFFNNYQSAYQEILSFSDQIICLIKDYFKDSKEAFKYINFIKSKEKNINYVNLQIKSYIEAFFEMQRRKIYKEYLEKLYLEYPEEIKSEPVLLMYYLSDKNRLSTFYLSEDKDPDIFNKISCLAIEKLGVSKIVFNDYEANVAVQKLTILKEMSC